MHLWPEPYARHPAEVKSLGTISSTPIHFVYRLQLNRFEGSVVAFLVELPPIFHALFVVAGICNAALFCVDTLLTRGQPAALPAAAAAPEAKDGLRPPAPRHFQRRAQPRAPARQGHLREQLELRLLTLFGMLVDQTPPRLGLLSRPLLQLSCLLFLLYAHQLCLLLAFTVKTDLVVLDLSDVMDRPEQLLRNHRQPCFFAEEKYLLDFELAPPGTALHSLWNKHTADRCILFRSGFTVLRWLPKVDSIVIVGPLVYLYVLRPQVSQKLHII